MIKILHLITDLDTGGAEVMLNKLVTSMDKSKYNNIVVSLIDKGTQGFEIEEKGIKVYTLDQKRGVPRIGAISKLLKIIKHEKPDIIQTWLYHADLLGTLAAKFFNRIPLSWNIRCSYMDLSQYSRLSSLVIKLNKVLSSLTDVIIVNSEAGKIFHAELGYRSRMWRNIPNGFDLNKFKPDLDYRKAIRRNLGLSEDIVLIGMVARYDPMKDYGNLLGAIELLVNDKTNVAAEFRFLLVGTNIDYGNKSLMEILEQRNIKEKIILLGERSDIPAIMAALDIYCSSSISEGFPNVIGEAMSCGVPCVVTKAGDSALIVNNSEYVVPPQSAEALAEACDNMIKKILKGKKLGDAVRTRIVDNFSHKVFVDKTFNQLKMLIKQA